MPDDVVHTDQSSMNQSWVDKGTPAPETPVVATPEPAAVVETPTPVVATPEPVVEYEPYVIKAGAQEIKLPKGATIAIERKGQTLFVPVTEMRSSTMMEYDYRHKTEEHARERREFESREAARQADAARVEAYEKDLLEREAVLMEAMGDPVKLAQWEEHQRMLATNPVYKQAWTDAQGKRGAEAENATFKAQQTQQAIQLGVEKTTQWLQDAAQKYPTVDPERIRVQYAKDLVNGAAELDPGYVEKLFKDEAAYLGRHLTPLEKQMEELRATVASLTSATAGNAQTQHAVQRNKAPNVGPAGQPASPVSPPRKHEPVRSISELNERWVKQA